MQGKKNNKKGYQRVEEQQWIQMVDLNDPKNENMSRKFAVEEGKKYQQKNSQQINENNTRKNELYPDLSYQLNQKEKVYQDKNKQNERNPIPRQQKKIKKPSIPMMFVNCEYCTVSQNVPGNTQVYTCGSCENMNECEPLYGVFICGFCQTKVCFGFGISTMIKCPKCKSINKVPTEAKKNYESLPKPQNLGYESQVNRQYERQRERQQLRNNQYNQREQQSYNQFRYHGIE